MIVNKNTGGSGKENKEAQNKKPVNTSTSHPKGSSHQAKPIPTELGWKAMTLQSSPRQFQDKGRRRLLVFTGGLLFLLLIFASVRMFSVAIGTNDQLVVKIGNQQTALVDLRQSIPISPDFLGVNVFPETGTSSLDSTFTGFMDYTPPIVNGLQSAHIKLLRFPGGDWSERQSSTNAGHILSLDQLYAFSTLLAQVHADGMIQARLSSPIDGTGKPADLATRANAAGRWVDFMNNPKSDLRKGKYNTYIHPIKLWTVGNEPDRLINPETQKPYTVAEYVNDFISYSLDMHRNDPTIKIYGPEISQFYGIGIGPTDANGQLWMEQFLQGVGAYEQAHHVTLLDGVSFHRYPFPDARQDPSLLLSSPEEWNYLLPSLRQLIRQDLKREVPVAVTEINTNPKAEVPTRGNAALWWADTLGSLMSQQIESATFFSAEGVDTPYPLFTSVGLQQTPMFRVMQLFAQMQHNFVPVGVQHDPISVYVTQDDTHQKVGLIFINKSSASQLAQISSQSSFMNTSPWHNVDVSLAPYSIVQLTLHRNAGAEATSYIVPFSNKATTGQLQFTVCGKKTDALQVTIPC